jgi:magnesium chelatase family protein
MGSSKSECTETQKSRYYSKIEAESSEEIRKRVSAAREIQLRRFEGRKIYANARMGPKDVNRHCPIGTPHISEAIQYRMMDRMR